MELQEIPFNDSRYTGVNLEISKLLNDMLINIRQNE